MIARAALLVEKPDVAAGGERLALGSADDHILDRGIDPGRIMSARYPSFFWKRWLRRSLDFDPPNALYDWTLATPMMSTEDSGFRDYWCDAELKDTPESDGSCRFEFVAPRP